MDKNTKHQDESECSCKECETQKKLYKKMFGFVSSRFLFFTIGLFVSIAVLTAYAAWNDHVSPGDSLTATKWNDLVDYVDAATSGTGSSYTAYGTTTCAAGWTVAYTGQIINVGVGTGGRDRMCVGSSRTNRDDGVIWGNQNTDHNYLAIGEWPTFTKMIDCVMCVK